VAERGSDDEVLGVEEPAERREGGTVDGEAEVELMKAERGLGGDRVEEILGVREGIICSYVREAKSVDRERKRIGGVGEKGGEGLKRERERGGGGRGSQLRALPLPTERLRKEKRAHPWGQEEIELLATANLNVVVEERSREFEESQVDEGRLSERRRVAEAKDLFVEFGGKGRGGSIRGRGRLRGMEGEGCEGEGGNGKEGGGRRERVHLDGR